MRCLDCLFFRPDPGLRSTVCLADGTQSPIGHCLRYPPRIVMGCGEDMTCTIESNGACDMAAFDKEVGHMGAIGVWPIVSPNDWCGEFRPREIP